MAVFSRQCKKTTGGVVHPPRLLTNRIIKRLFVRSYKFVSHFFFEAKGAKKKLSKRNAEKGISPSDGGEEGSAPSTAQAFEKA